MEKSYRAELVGVFGCPIDENPTVVLEEAAFQALGLHYRYINYKVEAGCLESAIKALTALNMRGINLTIPHKCAVIPYLDELSAAARTIGAVNTIVVRDGKLFGENTDGKGFLTSLTGAGVSPQGKRVVVLGAGGAASAIAVELALAGASHITIVNRAQERGQQLAALLSEKTNAASTYVQWNGTYTVDKDTDILVNATPVGLYPNVAEKPDVDYGSIRPSMMVCDVITNHPHTQFLQEAEKRGASTLDGLGMLVNQGAINFTLWTGVEAPVDVMMAAMRNEFGL